MTAIWHDDGQGWRALAPTGFPAEAALHDLVERAPQLLPLSGSPRLVVVGREVVLGSGKADLLAIEPSGRLAIIEIKLAHNAEARRAVVAQVLAYAAFLRGWDAADLEAQILAKHLSVRGYANLAEAAAAADQEGAFDAAAFAANLGDCLATGGFRLVFVLDEAPADLVRLVGYLETVADRLTIDLVTVASYAIGGAQALVPRRVETGNPSAVTQPTPPGPPGKKQGKPPAAGAKGWLANGSDDFAEAIAVAPAGHRPLLTTLCDWARGLEGRGWVKLATYHGTADRLTLLPRLPGEDAGLVTIWNAQGVPSLSLWRSVFDRLAPASIPAVEAAIAPVPLGQGRVVSAITPAVLDALAAAYAEA
ncbi:MAG TPA: hypothetical protein VIL85_10505, partial [Thermomicrobiales bacterium]